MARAGAATGVTTPRTPDGRAFGGAGATVKTRADLRAALIAAQSSDTFTVIAAIIERGSYDGRI